MKVIRTVVSALIGVPIALLYGLLVRLTFGAEQTSDLLATMTCSFLFLVPMAIGALTVWLAPSELKTSPYYAIFMPWISIFIIAAGSLAIALEAAICIVMALPIFLFLSSAGGWLALSLTKKSHTPNNNLLGIILLAPYLVTPIEMQLPVNSVSRVVETQIRVNTSANVLWENLVEIPYVNLNEQEFSIFHTLGVPKLLKATSLTFDGIGGTRNVVFDNGLAFTETVTYWDKSNRINFSIAPNEQSTAPAPYSMVGKKYFAVTDMKYWIEPIDHNTVILHLTSQHQLTTRFNSYAGIWTDLMLRSLQSYVLRMIKARAENPS